MSRRLIPTPLLGSIAALVSAFTSAQAATLLIDFGPNDGQAANGVVSPAAGTVVTANNGSTGVADAFGHYWNNAIATATTPTGGFIPTALTGLITTENTTTLVGVSFSGGWKANGIQNGGLLAPNAALLGDFAVATATQDYFFTEIGNGTNGTASLTINNLDPSAAYNLDMFATRNTASIRNTLYVVTDAFGPHNFTLQTSGAGSGTGTPNGNDDTLASFTGLFPDASGNLNISINVVTASSNTFAYLGALRLTQVPEPGTGVFALAACTGLLGLRRRRPTISTH